MRLHRPSPSLVISCIALFVALGGVGYAAATGSIDGREIKNNAVASKDLKNNDVRGKDVRRGTLNGSDVANNALTGSDINESGLGKVPSAGQADNAATATSAASAGNANTVGGQRIIPFVYRSDINTDQAPLAKVGGMELLGSCGAGDNDLFLKNLSGATAEITFNNVDDVAGASGGLETATANDAAQNLATVTNDDGASGQATFVTAAGRPVRVLYTLDEDQAGFDCSISGLVIG